MPWTETEPMKERMRFVAEAEHGLYSMSELCARYGISRRTGYKWLARYEADGPTGMQERSRAPHHCPHRIDAGMATAIVEVRRQHPSWGPRKLLAWLQERWLLNGKLGGFGPLQDPVDVPRGNAPSFQEVTRIGHETTVGNEAPRAGHRR